jgi:hypothetical protein
MVQKSLEKEFSCFLDMITYLHPESQTIQIEDLEPNLQRKHLFLTANKDTIIEHVCAREAGNQNCTCESRDLNQRIKNSFSLKKKARDFFSPFPEEYTTQELGFRLGFPPTFH